MYDMEPQHQVEIKTGGEDDVIQINGIDGKPGNKDYHLGYGHYLEILATADHSIESTRRENNVLSFKGMSQKNSYDYDIIGIKYYFGNSSFEYMVRGKGAPKTKEWGREREKTAALEHRKFDKDFLAYKLNWFPKFDQEFSQQHKRQKNTCRIPKTQKT